MAFDTKSRTWLEGGLRFKQAADGPLVYYPWSYWSHGYEVPDAKSVQRALRQRGGEWHAVLAVFALLVTQFFLYVMTAWLLNQRIGHQFFFGWYLVVIVATSIRRRIVVRRCFKRSSLCLTHTEVALEPLPNRAAPIVVMVALSVTCFALTSGFAWLDPKIERDPMGLPARHGLQRLLIVGQFSCVFITAAWLRAYPPTMVAAAGRYGIDFFKVSNYACICSFILLDLFGL